MADTKVEDELAAGALTGAEIFYCIQGGGPRRTTTNDIRTFLYNPTAGTLNRALDIVQVGPIIGSTVGPISFNLITSEFHSAATPAGLTGGDSADFGNWQQAVNALRVNFTVGGMNMRGESTCAATFHLRHTQASVTGDMVGGGFIAYSNADNSGGYGGLYGGFSSVRADSGSNQSHIVGFEVAADVMGTAVVVNRTAINALNSGSHRASAIDTAYAITSGVVGGEFKTGMLNSGGLMTGGTYWSSVSAVSLLDFFSCANVTITGNITNFPNWQVSGAGVLKLGPIATGLFNAAAGYIAQFTTTSGGLVCLASRPDGVNGYNGMDNFSSTGFNELAILTNEAGRTSTMFGIAMGNYNQIVSLGTSNNGLVIGTTVNKPVVFGANNAEHMRCTGTAVNFILPVGSTQDITISKALASINLNGNGGSSGRVVFQLAGVTQSLVLDGGTAIVVGSDATASNGMYIIHGANAWTAISDARLLYKKKAKEITNKLPKLDDFHLYEARVNGGMEIFVKAQELHKLFPQQVKVGSDDVNHEPAGILDPNTWGVSYDRLGAIALAYLKKHDKRIAQLEKR